MGEEHNRQNGVSRRQFLLAGGAMAAGTCFSRINVREALAESRRLGKPVLTDAAFTERLASLRKGPAFRQEIEDMKRSLPTYLETRYVLNAKQRELIGQLNPKQTLVLNENLDQALRMNLGVRLQIPSRAECARLQLTFQYTPQELVITALT